MCPSRHSVRQAEYALFKDSLLEQNSYRWLHGLRGRRPRGRRRRNTHRPGPYTGHRALGLLRPRASTPIASGFLPGLESVNSTPRMLAIWFMDDGYTRIRPTRQPLSEIATCGFNDDDRHILLEEPAAARTAG